MSRLTREEVARRLFAMGPDRPPELIAAARRLYGSAGLRKKDPGGPRRDPDQRRRLAGDPWKYIRDILGYRNTPDQERALELIEKHERVLLPSGNNTGKTHLLGSYALYRFDAVGAMPNEEMGLEEQGALILLPGPDHLTIFATIFSAILEQARRAEQRGYPMPGERSEKSVLWRVRPRWQMEAFAPQQVVGQEVAASASGRHHRNQIAIIEEGQGVGERIWAAAEGMCSGSGNKIVSAFNPTEPRGAAYKRARGKGWKVLHISAMRHPNVLTRTPTIPDAIDFKVIDRRVQNECRDMGPASTQTPDETELDFVYALPPTEDAPEAGARKDSMPGHARGELRVYRPLNQFAAQVLGAWPRTGTSSLFDPGALDRAMARWKTRTQPSALPDAVGVDPAREGRDTTASAPRWGDDAETLLRSYQDAIRQGPKEVQKMQAERRQYVGELWTLPKGDGVDTALLLWNKWPLTCFVVDEGGIGASVFDHLNRVLGALVLGLSFGAAPREPTPGESWSDNVRTQLYLRAALLVSAGLTDLPDDPSLREELLAHTTSIGYRNVTEVNPVGKDRKVRKPSLFLIEKDKVKAAIGRSPDRADAWVLAVNGDPNPPQRRIEAW